MERLLKQVVTRQSKWRNFPMVTVFLLPILTIWTVSLGGELMLSDITVLILTPLIVLSNNFNLRQPFLRPIVFFLLLWFLGVILSDIINENNMNNFLRGALNVVFFGLHIFVFFVLINGKKERYTAAIIGVALAFLLRWVTGNSEYSEQQLVGVPWKMGGGLAVTVIVIQLLSWKFKDSRRVGQIMLFLSPVHLLLNARSLFLTTAIAAFLSSISVKRYVSKRGKIVIPLIFGGLLFFALPLGSSIYSQLVTSGFFGEEAQYKHAMQTGNGSVNIILAGRSEILISLKAIEDAPFIGHGSWPESQNYYYDYLKAQEAIGKDVNWARAREMDSYLIPSHSILFGTWVSHGILGTIFWVYILILAFKSLSLGILTSKPTTILNTLILIVLIWDLFFSPFGQMRRCTVAISIVVACCQLHKNTKKA